MRNRHWHTAFFFCATCLCCWNGTAFSAYNPAGVHQIITRMGQELAADPLIPGLSIAVLEKGGTRPVLAAFGVACIENSTPMTTLSKFKVGSVTKLFTASLIHRLIKQGKLAYDTPISQFFPTFPRGNEITVANLLNHTSGIEDMLSLPRVQANMAKYRTPQELLEIIRAHPLLFQPGTQQKYSNSGYLMLAEISEQVSGKSYSRQIADLFIKKLGMASLVVGSDTAIVPELACGYSYAEGSGLILPIAASIAIAKGTGNLEGTPGDIVRLVNLATVFGTDVPQNIPLTPLILSNGEEARFIAEGYTGSFLNGYTLFMFTNPPITLAGKLGSFPGFGSVYFYDQQTQIAVAISVNNEHAIDKIITLGAKILHELRN